MSPTLQPIVLQVDEDRPLKTNIKWKPIYADPYSAEFITASIEIIQSLEEAYQGVVDSTYGLRTAFQWLFCGVFYINIIVT